MLKENKEIHFDSNEAAQYKTGISGWVDSDGRFWGEDERSARYSGCTHMDCPSCGNKMKARSWCSPCRENRISEEFDSYPLVDWDNDTPFSIYDTDNFFFDLDSFAEFVSEHELALSEIKLVVSKPRYLQPVDTEYWEDDIPHDGDDSCIPNEVIEVLDKLNEVIGNNKHVISWEQGKTRLDPSALLKGYWD